MSPDFWDRSDKGARYRALKTPADKLAFLKLHTDLKIEAVSPTDPDAARFGFPAGTSPVRLDLTYPDGDTDVGYAVSGRKKHIDPILDVALQEKVRHDCGLPPGTVGPTPPGGMN